MSGSRHPLGSSAVVVAVPPTTRSTLTPVIVTFLEAMSIPAERALKQRRVLMESFLLCPSSFTQ